MESIDEILAEVNNEASFIKFVKALIKDREPHEEKTIDDAGFSGEWANSNISGFLESAVSWAESSNFGLHQEPELAENKWKQFAVFLYCGKIYE